MHANTTKRKIEIQNKNEHGERFATNDCTLHNKSFTVNYIVIEIHDLDLN